jgi:sucrase/ferredoxin-like protein
VTSCSELSLALGEPLPGTAPYARSWLLIEEPRAWGRKAVREAGFGDLEARAKEAGARVGLVRRAGRGRASGPRRVFLARCASPDPFVDVFADPDLEAFDVERPPAGERLGQPLYLVCTNGRRDMCCGRAGRELARALAAELGEHLWETTHVGGHRFAPNLVCLPHGLVYSRLDVAAARLVVAAYEQGRVELEHLRGRTSLEPEAQARDWFARRATGRLGLDENPAEGLSLRVEPELLDPRPESCGGEPKRPVAWRLLAPDHSR